MRRTGEWADEPRQPACRGRDRHRRSAAPVAFPPIAGLARACGPRAAT